MLKHHLLGGVRKGALTQDQADAKFTAWLEEKENKINAKKDGLSTSKADARAKQLEDFLKPGAGVINSINKLDAGFNCPEASIGIILGYDSSQTKNTQRIGRLIRIFEGKSDAKIFTLVLKGTVEEKWASNKSTNVYITLDEDGLDKLLTGKQYTPKKEKQTQLTLRF